MACLLKRAVPRGKTRTNSVKLWTWPGWSVFSETHGPASLHVSCLFNRKSSKFHLHMWQRVGVSDSREGQNVSQETPQNDHFTTATSWTWHDEVKASALWCSPQFEHNNWTNRTEDAKIKSISDGLFLSCPHCVHSRKIRVINNKLVTVTSNTGNIAIQAFLTKILRLPTRGGFWGLTWVSHISYHFPNRYFFTLSTTVLRKI